MSFVPSIPVGGIAGWRFLEKTQGAQRAAFERGPMLQREIAYFKENIGKVTSAEALVKDRRLLAVALGAFGLEDEIDKRFFIRKILESDLKDPRSLASRMSAPGFKKMTEAFGFAAEGGPATGKAGFADKIVESFKLRQFERAVGDVDDTLRLAMNFRREIAEIASGGGSEGSAWFAILGSRPLREVVQGALGLPKEFAKIDVDRQRDVLRSRMQSAFGDGSIGFFKDAGNVERVITRFLARAQVEAGMSGGVTSPALQLLQGGDQGSMGLFNLLASRR